MFTDFSNRLTYFGTLDDVVYRYPGPVPLDAPAIQQQLLTAAIYDKKILINDGYLITNPHLLDDLEDIDRSLIGNLMMTGIARLFARGGSTNLAGALESGAEKIDTHRRIVSDTEKWRRMRDDLEFLSRQVGSNIVKWPADKNMGELYYSLMKRARGLPDDQRCTLMKEQDFRNFDDIFDRFDGAVIKPTYERARSEWEKQCWIHFAQKDVESHEIANIGNLTERQARFPQYNAVRRMMNVANEIYHLAYSIGAGHSIASSPPGGGVDPAAIGMASNLVTAFPDLLGPEQPPAFVEDRGIIGKLNGLLIGVPARIRFKDDFFFVTRLTTNGNCRRARAHYLEALQAFVNNGTPEREKLAAEARDTYASALHDQLVPGMKREWYETLMARTVSFGAGAALAGAATFIPLPGPVLPVAAKQLVSFLFPLGFDHLKNRFIERLMARRLDVALREPGVIAQQQANAPSLARQYGLYMGPLNTDGAKAAIAPIKPFSSTPPAPRPG